MEPSGGSSANARTGRLHAGPSTRLADTTTPAHAILTWAIVIPNGSEPIPNTRRSCTAAHPMMSWTSGTPPSKNAVPLPSWARRYNTGRNRGLLLPAGAPHHIPSARKANYSDPTRTAFRRNGKKNRQPGPRDKPQTRAPPRRCGPASRSRSTPPAWTSSPSSTTAARPDPNSPSPSTSPPAQSSPAGHRTSPPVAGRAGRAPGRCGGPAGRPARDDRRRPRQAFRAGRRPGLKANHHRCGGPVWGSMRSSSKTSPGGRPPTARAWWWPGGRRRGRPSSRCPRRRCRPARGRGGGRAHRPLLIVFLS
ncbi:hypothetical protein S1361_37655 [Streptomyces cyanogenus]|uniref:Uncharacterized protein n=1 Tax=Streptomyces cyanogenus TaxID=80860 RepID=A0ABX7U3K6_STRCY|nr:hypothetical protein S1361_37655 [Streptomyces cyanogenus]